MKNLTNQELEGYLAGYLLSDGCRFKRWYSDKYNGHYYYHTRGNNKDKDIIEKVTHILNKLYNADVKTTNYRIQCCGGKKKERYFQVSSQKKRVYDATAKLVTVNWIEKQDFNTKIQIIKGLLEGDGTIAKQTKITFSIRFENSNIDIISIYTMLLKFFDIPYNYHYNRSMEIYSIRCNWKNSKRLYSIITPLMKRQEEKIRDIMQRREETMRLIWKRKTYVMKGGKI